MSSAAIQVKAAAVRRMLLLRYEKIENGQFSWSVVVVGRLEAAAIVGEQQLLVLGLEAYAWNATAKYLLGNFAHVERRRRLFSHRARGGHFESDWLRHVSFRKDSIGLISAGEITGG